MAIVYKITHRESGKAYIGMTVRTIDQRFSAHQSSARNNSPFRFHSAIRKHGVDAWTKEILEESADISLIRNREEYYISLFKTQLKAFGYNAKPGGCGGNIVPVEKRDMWLDKQRLNGLKRRGVNNPNASGLTKELFFEEVTALATRLGRVPGYNTVRKEYPHYPKSLAAGYWGRGKYPAIAKQIAADTGLTYNPFFRDQAHREVARSTMRRLLDARWHATKERE